jgi:hypothetical protein
MMKRFKTGVFCASFLVSFLLLVEGAFADIQMTTQLIDPQGAKGRINARIQQAYPNVDVYVGMITATGALYCLRGDESGSHWDWETGVHPLMQGVSLTPTDWLTLQPLDLSQVMADLSNSRFVVVLVRQGTDPIEPQNWVYAKVADFVTHPFERMPGQALFASAPASSALFSPMTPNDAVFSSAGTAAPPSEDDSSDSQPEKADIFKISGQTLFYANGSSMRFQMIDLKDPAKPALLASIPIRETPRELFLVGDHAFLIGSTYSVEGPSTALRVYRTGETIQEVQHVDFDQLSYLTSRRLGNRIYLVGTDTTPPPCCEWLLPGQAAIHVIDIAVPEQPSVIAHTNAGSNVFDVYMDNRYLVVLGQAEWPNTSLEILDLSTDVPLSRKATLSIPGLVPSEHHIHGADSQLYVVYQQATLSEGSTLAVYDLSDFPNISEAGQVGGIAPGEALFATRFTDERAYVVTYQRQDPLWVVDLSTQNRPRIVGELQVPGWSEYMEFFDDRLLAIGYDDSQGKRLISVALFSVADPSSPVLLDRVTPLSEKAFNTYSEATSDDRAFAFNQETGMVLFPLHGYDDWTGMNLLGLEILKLKEGGDGFSWQSHVKSRFYVLRGSETDQSDIVLSMGDAGLNSIDISTPSEASVVGELRLAYDVNQVAGRDSSHRLWTMERDSYGIRDSELILFQEDNLDIPAMVQDAGLGWAQLLMNDQLGVLFAPPRLRAVDLQNVTLGGAVEIQGVTPWSLQSPLLSGHVFHVASITSSGSPWPFELLPLSGSFSTDGITSQTVSTGAEVETVQWRLFRYDCSDFQAPSLLPELSIPGRPVGFTWGGKLVTMEEVSTYDPVAAMILPGPADSSGGILINLLTIQHDQAVLEASRFFPYETFGYPTVATDQRAIYVSFSKDQSTTVITLSPDDLSDVRTDTLEGIFRSVKAFDGKLLLETTYWGIMPLGGVPMAIDAAFAPVPWYPPEVAVYDLTVTPPEKILSLEGEYVDEWGAHMDDTGLYLAKGYAGVSFIPF